MKKILRAVSLVLCLLLCVLSAVSCSETENKPSDENELPETNNTVNETGNNESEYDPFEKVELPDKSYGGHEFRVFCPAPFGEAIYDNDDLTSESDAVEEAVFNRNLDVENRFDVLITAFDADQITDNQASYIKQSVLTNDMIMDVACVHTTQACAELLMSGCLTTWNNVPYIDLEKIWWNQSINETCSIFDNIYFISGAYNWRSYKCTGCILFNKDLAEQYVSDDLYQVVKDGKWDMDYLLDITSSFSEDLNHDGLYDIKDRVAISFDNESFLYYLLGGFRQPTAQKGNNDVPELTVSGERMQNIVEKCYELIYENRRGYIYDINKRGDYVDAFAEGHLLFLPTETQYAFDLREMDTDFGILPYPKLDNTQENYGAMTDAWGLVCCIPSYNDDLERTGIIMEALCEKTYDIVVPAIYDGLLQGITTRDNESKEMLDIIFNNIYYDFGYVYDNYGKGFGRVVVDLMRNRSTDLQSYVAGKKNTVESYFADLYAAASEYKD